MHVIVNSILIQKVADQKNTEEIKNVDEMLVPVLLQKSRKDSTISKYDSLAGGVKTAR